MAETVDSTHPLVSIVIAVYNEAATLGQIVERVHEALAKVPHEIVLVDDGSTDGTGEVIRQIPPRLTSPRHGGSSTRSTGERDNVDWVPDASGMTNLRVLTHATNLGKGAALRTGFAACRAGIVVVQE